ncbi:methyl-accepting chemotaxis protein [Alkalibacterium subtropicum]|uniref:methyl-accepting chemotaxis protein n=1 Tax=Alkalibacterium subtropicum TaxID=753702 RepID=UPI0015A7046D|nr:methyl-accepting chemotaxis protein [Alkalibacterium subtropicum]
MIILSMFTLPFIINLALTSQMVWSVIFLYLFLSLLYLDKKVYALASVLGLFNLAAIIYFDPTAASDQQEIAVMFILYILITSAGLFVAINGDKLISQMEKTTEASDIQSKNLVDVIKAAQTTITQLDSSSSSLTDSSSSILHASKELEIAMDDIASSTSSQAEDTENGVSHVVELGELLSRYADYMTELHSKTHRASHLRESSKTNLVSLTGNTEKSINNVEKIDRMIRSTSHSVEKIEKASAEIANISEQTNLLALNASIEAARAGEEGKGFAVVAEEIRKLAEKSSQFNEEIAEVIRNLTEQAQGSVGAVDTLNTITSEQLSSLSDTNSQFDSLSEALITLEKVIDLVSGVGDKMKDKTERLIEIMHSLSASSEENASTTEEISASISSTNTDLSAIAKEIEVISHQIKELEKVTNH